MADPRAIVVIPARLQSTRLPGKVLADIHGHPMLWHVYRRATGSRLASDVLVATDSEEVAQQVTSWGARAIMTSPDCSCGTERIASIVDQLDGEIIVNVQGDEPLIDPAVIDDLITRAIESGADMVEPVVRITSNEVLTSPTTVKVVIREDGTALYFSRSPIPFVRDAKPANWVESTDFWLVVGMYAFKREVLSEYLEWPESNLEKLEKVEQLRFLEAGKRILTFETSYRSMAVDTPEDLENVKLLMARGGGVDS